MRDSTHTPVLTVQHREHTAFEFPLDATTGRIVGRVAAFAQHPNPGTLVLPFPDANAYPTDGAALFALVSVDWATRMDTFDASTGIRTTRYIPGALGMPRGMSWNLRPAVVDDEGQIVLAAGSWAAGHHTLTLPAAVRDQVPSAAAQVRIHDHRI